MRRKISVVILTIVLLGLTIVPAMAQTGIDFLVKDNKTGQPWGTVAGQQYQITVTDGTNGTVLLDTGLITAPPVLDFTCDFGAVCPAGNGTTLATPASSALLIVEVNLTGTAPNEVAPNLSQVYFYDANNSSSYLIFDQLTGTGPTAISMAQANAGNASSALPLVALAVLFLAGTTLFVIRRRPTV